MFPRDAPDPGVGDNVLRVVDSEKTEVKVAGVHRRRRQNQQTEDERVQLPWTG